MNLHAMAMSASLQFRMLVDLCYFGASAKSISPVPQTESLNAYSLEAFGAAPNNPRREVAVWAGIIGLPGSGIGSGVDSGVRDLLRERLLERCEALRYPIRNEKNNIQ